MREREGGRERERERRGIVLKNIVFNQVLLMFILSNDVTSVLEILVYRAN